MGHPGKLIYAHSPGADGWQFFVVTYYPFEHRYSVRCQPHQGELIALTGPGREIVSALTEEIAPTVAANAEVALRAAAKIQRRLERH